MPERAVGEGDVKQTEGSVDNDDEAEFVEVDPTGRYGRYGEVLGRGAFKTVYRAFDEVDGIEVAWNKVRVQDVLRNPADLERLYSEVHLLKTLKHKNIIKFYTSWVDARSKDVNFITEIFTSGTLRQYRKKHKHVDIKAVKNWARQILRGLLYLHSHDPPVIHRDLKCDNIFVNGHQGEVKIGDLGLATILHRAQAAHSVIGTPEFMAPELYEEEYNELVDIYSFGMCVLEMVTFEYPYSECANAAQIFKKVTSGIRPAALDKVKDPEVRSFVEKCLATASRRLPARELLMDPFLCCEGDRESTECSTTLQSSQSTTDLRTLEKCVADQISHSKSDLGCQKRCGDKTSSDNGPSSPTHSETSTLSSFAGSLLKSRDFVVKGRRREDDTVFLRVRIADHNGRNRNIHFPFDIEADSALSVASEMVAELDLSDQDVTTIADMIDAEVLALVPDWKPGASFDENGDDGFGQTDIPCSDEWQQRGPPVQNTHENTMYGRFEELSCLSVESQHCLSDSSAMSSGDSFSNVDDSSIAELSLSSTRQNNANIVDMTNDVDCNVVLNDGNSSEYTGQQDSTGTYSFNELVEAKRNSASEKSMQIWEGIVVHDCSVEACTCHDCMGTGVSGLVDQSHVDNICLNAFLEASTGTAFEQAEVVETLSTVTAIGQAMIVGTLSSSLQENKHGALPVAGSDATKSGSFITDGMEASADSLIEDPSHLLKLLALRHQQELEQLQHKHEQALLELKNSFKRSKNTDCELVSAPEMQLGNLVVQLDGAELSNRLLIPEEARAPGGGGNNGEITTGMVLCRTQLDVAEQNNQCPLKNICNADFVNPLYDSEVKLISLQTGDSIWDCALNQSAVSEMPNAGERNLDSDFISGIECCYKVGLHEEQMVCTISSDSVLEQLKREQLQKSIADMEARTLENLQQSYKNGYSVSAAGKKKVVGALHGSLAG